MAQTDDLISQLSNDISRLHSDFIEHSDKFNSFDNAVDRYFRYMVYKLKSLIINTRIIIILLIILILLILF